MSDWKFFVDMIIIHQCSVRFVDIKIAKFDMNGVSTSDTQKTWEEKYSVLQRMLPYRVLIDYKRMKSSECLTQQLSPQLRKHYKLDKIVSRLVKMFIIIYNRL